jgi:curli biogenesis system outer membrane secretion channel CsgG
MRRLSPKKWSHAEEEKVMKTVAKGITTLVAVLSVAMVSSPASAQIWEKLTNRKSTINVPHPPQIVLKGINRIAVMEFKGECGGEVTEKITDVVSRSQRYELVDRANLDSLLGEQGFQQSESVSASTSAKLGKMLGAAILVTGRVTRCVVRTSDVMREGSPVCSRRGGCDQTYVVKTSATISGGMQIVDVTTGKTLARTPLDVEHVVPRRAKNDPYVAPADQEQVRSEAFTEASMIFERLIIGWNEQIQVLIYDDDKWNLKTSANQLKSADFDGAAQTVKSALESFGQGPDADPKMLSKAWYNLGLALMYGDHLDESIEALQRSNNVRSTDIVTEAMAKCRKMIALRDEGRRKEEHAVEVGAAKAQPADPAKPALTNADIANMARARLPETVIISKIKSGNCNFDGSPNALIQLRNAGATDAVLVAVTERSK